MTSKQSLLLNVIPSQFIYWEESTSCKFEHLTTRLSFRLGSRALRARSTSPRRSRPSAGICQADGTFVVVMKVDVRQIVFPRVFAVFDFVFVVATPHVVAGVGDTLQLPLADVLVPVNVFFDQGSVINSFGQLILLCSMYGKVISITVT